MPKNNQFQHNSVLWMTGLILSSCATAPPPAPEEPLYTPNYSYPVAANSEKIDVTVGLIDPQFTGGVDATTPKDELTQNYLSGLRSGFNELLSAKGFNLTGPYASLDNMTFPEKKDSDIVLYPELDVALNQKIDITGTKQAGNAVSGYSNINLCDITLSIGGNISILALEPLSGEKMWVKRVEVSEPPQKFPAEAEACTGAEDKLPREVVNSRAKLFEGMFTKVMAALDKYVNAEEFSILKNQAAELREKKAY